MSFYFISVYVFVSVRGEHVCPYVFPHVCLAFKYRVSTLYVISIHAPAPLIPLWLLPLPCLHTCTHYSCLLLFSVFSACISFFIQVSDTFPFRVWATYKCLFFLFEYLQKHSKPNSASGQWDVLLLQLTPLMVLHDASSSVCSVKSSVPLSAYYHLWKKTDRLLCSAAHRLVARLVHTQGSRTLIVLHPLSYHLQDWAPSCETALKDDVKQTPRSGDSEMFFERISVLLILFWCSADKESRWWVFTWSDRGERTCGCICAWKLKRERSESEGAGSAESGTITSTVCHVSLVLTHEGLGGSS